MKRHLKNVSAFLTAAFILCSCEDDKSRMAKCKEVVEVFVANLPLDNYEVLYAHYPNFQKVRRYWKLSNFKITTTTIDDDKTVSIVGTALGFGNIMFKLKKMDGRYKIVDSKGLASDFDTPLYKYCKKIGCIDVNSYDKEVAQICEEKEDEFKNLVYKIKNNIQESVMVQNHNLSASYGYISGNVTVKNYSRFSIPGHDYELYFHFLDYDDKVVFSKKAMLNYESIPFGQSVTHRLFEPSNGHIRNVKAELKLTSMGFIEKVIADNIVGSDCIARSNLIAFDN